LLAESIKGIQSKLSVNPDTPNSNFLYTPASMMPSALSRILRAPFNTFTSSALSLNSYQVLPTRLLLFLEKSSLNSSLIKPACAWIVAQSKKTAVNILFIVFIALKVKKVLLQGCIHINLANFISIS
jgi:hypothetical protein